MIRQRLEALDQKPQEPLESDPHRATDAAQGNSFYEQAFDEAPLVLRDEVLLTALDELAPTVMAVMVLFTVTNVTIFLKLGRLTLWTHISDDHDLLLTSAGLGSDVGQQ
jgi:hypothetical protein